MADTQQQIAELSKRITALQGQLADLCADVAELNLIMTPFMARYQQLIWPYYESLAKTQREIADIRVAKGDKSAINKGEARSPLDRFFEDPSVQEQYERAWGNKSAPRAEVTPNREPPPEEIRQLYAEVVGYLHPELTSDPAERDRRRQLMGKIDDAYIRRDQPSLEAVAEMYRVRSSLPGRAPEDVVRYLHDRVVTLEVAIGKVEGQKYDLRYGMMAKIKAYAEQMWREEKRDLLSELSQEFQRSLSDARVELDHLQDEL
jgi:hypothetical protein